MQITFNSSAIALPSIFFWLCIWTFVWVIVLATALARKDFDPVTRLTWTLVIILVPVFGVVLYWVVAPKQLREPERELSDQPTTCVPCGATIPAGQTHCPRCGWSYVAS